jgi:hypothetical protein
MLIKIQFYIVRRNKGAIVSLLHLYGNYIHFCVTFLVFRILEMDEVRKLTNSQYYTVSSEPFRIYLSVLI